MNTGGGKSRNRRRISLPSPEKSRNRRQPPVPLAPLDRLPRSQIEASLKLADAVTKHLANLGRQQLCWLHYCPGDAPFVTMGAGVEICFDGESHYDAWFSPADGSETQPLKMHLDIAQAINVLTGAEFQTPPPPDAGWLWRWPENMGPNRKPRPKV